RRPDGPGCAKPDRGAVPVRPPRPGAHRDVRDGPPSCRQAESLMNAFLDTAGERLAIECSLPWVMELIAEGAAGELRESEAAGAWLREGELVIENACTAGFDLHLRHTAERAVFTYRWRPPARDRAAARILRSRFHLLARAILTQYPALWWAGTRGRAPLHASACVVGGATPLVTASSGIGRSTLVLGELRAGGRATGDNL